ncbi:unnamed protein product [Strongylus vulgaris]|uniref:Uncharacterized protein n=1 Tax=Strongylus vulgaris TaxID=40348 RepID=A0A3P7J8R2_STRVU|nr:unnamed protein product [Strongylus vulgaris]
MGPIEWAGVGLGLVDGRRCGVGATLLGWLRGHQECEAELASTKLVSRRQRVARAAAHTACVGYVALRCQRNQARNDDKQATAIFTYVSQLAFETPIISCQDE